MKRRNFIVKSVPLVKLLPNVVTLIGLVVGVSSIRFGLDHHWEIAVYSVLLAAVIDGLDGRVARFFNATSHFGAELDSLCDLINFGVSPAILMYLWSLQQHEYKVISWAAIMLFIVCMAIRLARFNTAIITPSEVGHDERFFLGVPAPSGAILVLMPMILDFQLSSLLTDVNIRSHTMLINIYIMVIALLLPSRLPTISLKKVYIKPEYLSQIMITAVIVIISAVVYPWYLLPLAALMYILSIPLCVYIVNKKP